MKAKKSRTVRYTLDTLPKPTKAQLRKLRGIRDEDIDCADIPELGEKFWKNARLMPALDTKQAVSLRIDPDVLQWFKEHGPRYQSRINAVLRAYVQAHKTN